MPLAQGTIGMSAIYNGIDKIGKIYRGTELCYQSYVYNPVIALIEKTIENVDVELTNEITKIGPYAFAYCYSLSSVTIPNSVIEIDTYAFQNCTSLTYITIPSSVTKIYGEVFKGCEKLLEMRIEATTPPDLVDDNAISEATTTIYVPINSVSAYQTAEEWVKLTTRETNPVTFVGY